MSLHQCIHSKLLGLEFKLFLKEKRINTVCDFSYLPSIYQSFLFCGKCHHSAHVLLWTCQNADVTTPTSRRKLLHKTVTMIPLLNRLPTNNTCQSRMPIPQKRWSSHLPPLVVKLSY